MGVDLREIARQVAIEGSYDGQNLVDRIEAALRAEREACATVADKVAKSNKELAADETDNSEIVWLSRAAAAEAIASDIRKGE
jgi:hypothetical protein